MFQQIVALQCLRSYLRKLPDRLFLISIFVMKDEAHVGQQLPVAIHTLNKLQS